MILKRANHCPWTSADDNHVGMAPDLAREFSDRSVELKGPRVSSNSAFGRGGAVVWYLVQGLRRGVASRFLLG